MSCRYFKCEKGSEAESECIEFFAKWEDGKKLMLALLKQVGAQRYDDGLFYFTPVETPKGMTMLDIVSGDNLIAWKINKRTPEGKSLAKMLSVAKDVYPDRLCFHIDIAGFPNSGGSFSLAYPASISNRFYIVVPEDGWDGKTLPPKGAVEIKASLWFAAKEKAEAKQKAKEGGR